MAMHARISLILLLLLFFQLYADEGFIFKSKRLENKIYRISFKSVSKTKIDFRGEKEMLDQLKSNGVRFPLKIEQEKFIVFKTETFPKNEKGFIPFLECVDSSASVQYVNGELLPWKSGADPDTSLKIRGFFKENEIIIDKITGNNVTPEIEKVIRQNVHQLVESIKFPDYPIKIGDSFSQSVPLAIPVQGITTVNLNIITHYTLRDINEKSAYFDIEQEYNLSSDIKDAKIILNGTGQGKLEYDRQEYHVRYLITDGSMEIKIDLGKVFLIFKADAKTEIKTKVFGKN
jgi:hypothetical protein